ncbi:MAG: hypothetical protein JO312_23495 [Hyphomicrobiales bacterium]|nr:hypothetical protein [Hyphomicrobiales bacterium]
MSSTITNARRVALTIGCSALALIAARSGAYAGNLISGDSLLVTMTTYEDVGQVAGLVAGVTAIPGGTAVADGDINTVWNNSSVDGQFGVTSPLTLQDLSATSGALLASETLDPSKLVTSFSSKSELGLSITQTASGLVATFMGYAPGGAGYPPTAAGMLDVSNADSTSYVDPTNVASQFYKSSYTDYAFNRSVVAVTANGAYSITPTLAYGGDNNRAAVLAPNGLYYTVGNSNSGTTTAPQLTTTTGLEVVTPGPMQNSTMIDPTFKALPKDKAGKSSNFRGLTYYDGNLYFTKGSGSNGIDTVYTVSKPGGKLPTAATANSATISILPGFPTLPAKSPGPDYTPFGLFFADPTTLYVADEGSGNATDAAVHAGLEKWTLSSGTWHLDYTLQDNLIGVTYDVTNWDYTETTSGLRNLTGRDNANGTVTLWATTATTSGSGDNGADPNEIVMINDVLGDTSPPTSEKFSVFDGPQFGVRYGGVAFAAPEASTWAMMLIGFMGLGFGACRRAKSAAPAPA